MTDIIPYNVDELDTSSFNVDKKLMTKQKRPSAQLQSVDLISLINLLTSPSDIDYELISDFFLTYRLFISQLSLLKVLLLRFKWSIEAVSDISHEVMHDLGKLSLVRTFVVLRHWLLNYFIDDFLPSVEIRKVFVESINSYHVQDMFTQRVLSTLKKHWTCCSNKAWDEKVSPESFDSFKIRIGPEQSSQSSKRLSQYAFHQQTDSVTRNLTVLATFDKQTIHRLPIPNPISQNRLQPKVFLNPKNSNLRLSIIASSQQYNRSQQGNIRKDKNNSLLYRTITGVMSPSDTNRIRGNAEFPNDYKPTEFKPPTPVKKMEIVVPLPPTSKPQPKGLKPLIENWIRTFHLHSSKQTKKENTPVEKFMRNVVSVSEPDNKALEKLADGKFDILSARTIDELEYLVQFHNALLSKHGPMVDVNTSRNSFSFTSENLTDIPGKQTSNIDNMNICECFSNISKSVVSFQNRSKLDCSEESDGKSHVSYDSVLSGHNNAGADNAGTEKSMKKKQKCANLREFNFESAKESKVDTENKGHNDVENFSFESSNQKNTESDEVLSLESCPTSIISESTNQNVIRQSMNDGPNRTVSNMEEHTDEIVPQEADDKAKPLLKEEGFVEERNQILEEEELLNNSDYDDIESFVSTYEEVNENVDKNSEVKVETLKNETIDTQNEPKTPPSMDGIISSTPRISPIKSLHESKDFTKSGSQTDSMLLLKSDKIDRGDNEVIGKALNLNEAPSFTRISNDSFSSTFSSVSQIQNITGERHLSYLSTRSHQQGYRAKQNPDRSTLPSVDHSNTTIFSDITKPIQKLANISVEAEKEDDETGILRSKEVFMKCSSNSNNTDIESKSISLIPSMSSDQFVVPYPGVDNEVVAELAAISDDSYTEDPIEAALLKLEGTYVKKSKNDANANLSRKQTSHSTNSLELLKQVEDLSISKPIGKSKRNSVFVDQRRKTKLFSLTPVLQKDLSYVEKSSSKILLDLLLTHKITNDILQVSNMESHISFILNFDSKTLAQQFTLIEKDALLEIDWKELIELKWDSNELISVNSWLELLVQNEDIHGIDLCISRFNLTVNWIISEILLTKNVTLRKITIQRFIHIAQNCKVLQNYSTLMQILLALGSDKIMKLKETWRVIEPGDILIYKNLESIASPFKNFFNLRSEINNLKPSLGCVPFLGLYLSDLIFNKEKNSCKDNKINFGKFRTTARIVKSLIQCIQWSSLYQLEVKEEILSKCLYIKTLTEDEMKECLLQIR